MPTIAPARFAELDEMRRNDGAPYDVTFPDRAEEWYQERCEQITRAQRAARRVVQGWPLVRTIADHPDHPTSRALVAALTPDRADRIRRIVEQLDPNRERITEPSTNRATRRDHDRMRWLSQQWSVVQTVADQGRHPLYQDMLNGLAQAERDALTAIIGTVLDVAECSRIQRPRMCYSPERCHPPTVKHNGKITVAELGDDGPSLNVRMNVCPMCWGNHKPGDAVTYPGKGTVAICLPCARGIAAAVAHHDAPSQETRTTYREGDTPMSDVTTDQYAAEAEEDDTGTLTEQETRDMLETYAAEIRELYTDREAIIGARELFADAWRLVENLGSTDPSGTGDKIRYHADPHGLVFVLAHMVNVAADAASFATLAEEVQAGLLGEFAPDQLAQFARTLPKMEQHPRADWLRDFEDGAHGRFTGHGRFTTHYATVTATFGQPEKPIDPDKSHHEWYLDTPHGKATIYDFGDCHDCGFGCDRDPRFGYVEWHIGAGSDAAAEWVLQQVLSGSAGAYVHDAWHSSGDQRITVTA